VKQAETEENRYPVRSSAKSVATRLFAHSTCALNFCRAAVSASICVVLIIVIGFPITLVLAWAFELTPEGIQARRRCRSCDEGDPKSTF